MLKNRLEEEIEKWSEKLDKKLSKVDYVDDSGEWLLENAEAYRQDFGHFMKNDDLIKAYEALIWSWAFIEIGEELNHISEK